MCANRLTGPTVYLTCDMWLQSELLVGLITKTTKLKYCINMLFVLLKCGIQNSGIDGLTSLMTTIGTIITKTT